MTRRYFLQTLLAEEYSRIILVFLWNNLLSMGLRKKLSWHSRKNKCPSFLHFCCDASSFNSFSLNLIPPSIDKCQSSYMLMCNLYISAGILWRKEFQNYLCDLFRSQSSCFCHCECFHDVDKLIWQPIQCFNVSMFLVSERAKCRNVNWCEMRQLVGVNKIVNLLMWLQENFMQNSKNVIQINSFHFILLNIVIFNYNIFLVINLLSYFNFDFRLNLMFPIGFKWDVNRLTKLN